MWENKSISKLEQRMCGCLPQSMFRSVPYWKDHYAHPKAEKMLSDKPVIQSLWRTTGRVVDPANRTTQNISSLNTINP